MLTKKKILNQFYDLKNLCRQINETQIFVLLDQEVKDTISYALEQSTLHIRTIQQIYEMPCDVDRDLWDAIQWCDQFMTDQIIPILADLSDAKRCCSIQVADLEKISDQAIGYFM